MEKKETDRLKQLQKFALDKGAYRAKTFSARLVAVDERVRMKCQIPLCPHFGRALTCPPNVPTVEEFGRALSRYKKALLIQTQSSLSGDISECDKKEVQEFFTSPAKTTGSKKEEKTETQKNFDGVRAAAVRLHKLINDVEGMAMGLGFPYALGLIGGECMLCPECVGPCSDKACRHPFKARPSMEGVGIDVIKTSVNAGLPFDCPPKTEVIWTGLILVD